MSCGKTDEPIQMPLGIWTWLGLRNHVLGGGPDPLGKTKFGGSFQPIVKYREYLALARVIR